MRFCRSVKQISRTVFALFFALIASGINISSLVQAQEKNTVDLSRFELLDTYSGWVLLNGHLFWSSNAGQSWKEIGPSILPGVFVQDVEFQDVSTGWALWTTANSVGGA